MKRDKNPINRLSPKTYLLVIGALVCAAALMGFIFRNDKPATAHYFNNPKVDIGEIDLYLFYAVPSDKQAHNFELVRSNAENLLGEISTFHSKQFLEKSKVNSKIYPKPLVLEKSGLEYDTNDTRRGNWEALKGVTLEIERRVFDKSGDLYDKEFIGSSKNYRVIAIIYEGVGASGTEKSLIISRDFLTMEQYDPVSSALFYHEFGHTIGMPEGYDINTGQAFTDDIMGAGRRNPIGTNYIDQSTLRGMGVLNYK